MLQRQLRILIATIIFAAAVAAAGLTWASQAPRAYAPRGAGQVYLALGDSLAWGFRLDDPPAESYPALIGAALRPIETVNLSVPGETSGSLLAGQVPRAVRAIGEARARGLRVSPITLGIGGNDLRGVERAGPDERAAAVEAARRNIARSLDQLRAAAGPTADIAVMTYYNPYGGDPAIPGGDAFWVERLNQAIREEAARRGVAVADIYPAFAGGRFYTHTFTLVGDIHANAQGHRLIADTFIAALRYSR